MRPAAQSLHVLELEPVASMNLPATHVTHTVAPWADMVFPRGHAEHDVCSEAPLKRPTSQSSHSLLRPKVFENRPGGHLLHFASALTHIGRRIRQQCHKPVGHVNSQLGR